MVEEFVKQMEVVLKFELKKFNNFRNQTAFYMSAVFFKVR